MVEQISQEMEAEASIVSSDTGGRAYAVGDLMTLSNLLSGLISSIVSSTAISLTVSLLVLATLTRRIGQSLLVIPCGTGWILGRGLDGAPGNQLERPDDYDHRAYHRSRDRLLDPCLERFESNRTSAWQSGPQ